NRVVLGWVGGLSALVGLIVVYFSQLKPQMLVQQSSLLSNLMLLAVIGLFLIAGLIKKINVFDTFVEGAKEGFQITIVLIPYLVAMLVAVGLFQASGLLDAMLTVVRHVVAMVGLDTRFVAALPTALMKPLSGSGARALMIQGMQQYGPDSLIGRMVCVIQGSTETTFYVIAVYFGSVGIRHTRHAISCALLAELAGIVSAILVSYWFYG
ncbi:MAG: spore maturation protein, partial [Pseudomonadota bacterium]|nr:spore maturation protein [Pseudomonadota bacterium]